jgi:hypothetical protein
VGKHLLTRRVAGELTHTFGVGNAEDLAGLQAVDVVGLEGRAIALEQGCQHLLDGDAVRTGLEGDAIEGIAGLDQISPACSGTTARGGGLAGRTRSGGSPGACSATRGQT